MWRRIVDSLTLFCFSVYFQSRWSFSYYVCFYFDTIFLVSMLTLLKRFSWSLHWPYFDSLVSTLFLPVLDACSTDEVWTDQLVNDFACQIKTNNTVIQWLRVGVRMQGYWETKNLGGCSLQHSSVIQCMYSCKRLCNVVTLSESLGFGRRIKPNFFLSGNICELDNITKLRD